MTEAEWESCGKPDEMLAFIGGRADPRRLRLFFCACLRRDWWDHPEILRFEIEWMEKHAADQASPPELGPAAPESHGCRPSTLMEKLTYTLAMLAEFGRTEGQSLLFRDIIGSPFRRARIDPSWLSWQGGAVIQLARAAYDERSLPSGLLDNTRLAVLADALEEAGCTVAEILAHLRSGGDHVLGCWAVDLLLGKS